MRARKNWAFRVPSGTPSAAAGSEVVSPLIACSEMPVAVSRMTVLRPKVSICRFEGSHFSRTSRRLADSVCITAYMSCHIVVEHSTF